MTEANVTPSQIAHLELHTHDFARARAFYSQLLSWRPERIETPWGSYQMLPLGRALEGGIVQCGAWPALWLPYIEVDSIHLSTLQARALGAAVLLGPREGPAGWRSVISTPAGGEIALWEQK